MKLESIIKLPLEIMLNAFTQYVSIYRLELFNIIPELSLLEAFLCSSSNPEPIFCHSQLSAMKKRKKGHNLQHL